MSLHFDGIFVFPQAVNKSMEKVLNEPKSYDGTFYIV